MAITVSTLNIVDVNGKSTTLLSTEVKEVTSFNGNVDVLVDVYGQDPQVIKTENTPSTGSVTITATGDISDVTVDGVSIIGATVVGTGDTAEEAFNLAVAINTFDSVPNYSATVSGSVVSILADKSLADAPNGFVVTSSGTATTTDVNLANGTDEKAVIEALLTDYEITVTLENGASKVLNVLEIRSVNENPSGGSMIYYNEQENTFQKVSEIVVTEDVATVKGLIDAL